MINRILGKRVKFVRKELGFSRKDLINKLPEELPKDQKFSAKMLQYNEDGAYRFTLERLYIIAQVLGVCVTDLIPKDLKKINGHNNTKTKQDLSG